MSIALRDGTRVGDSGTLRMHPSPRAGGRADVVLVAREVLERATHDVARTPYTVVLSEPDARVRGPSAGCARESADVVDPRNGRCVAVVSLVSAAEAANPLMGSYARSIAWTIEERLVDAGAAVERALTARFVKARRRARGAILAVSERVLMMNAAAARVVGDSDQSLLWKWTRRAIAPRASRTGEVRLTNGSVVCLRCEPVETANEAAGGLLWIERPRVDAASSPRRRRTRRATSGWDSLSASQLGIAKLVALSMTNQEIAARLFLSRHTIDFHLRQIFTKLAIESRVELALLVAQHTGEPTGAAA